MELTSATFENNQKIPAKYTCEGENINPPLEIIDVSTEAVSLALIVDDPDAPAGALRSGSGQAWVHWLVWNIDLSTVIIPEDSVPTGAMEGLTSFGSLGYDGPCPPQGHGEHRYFFKLYALDFVLDISPESEKDSLEQAMEGHILEKAELVGIYSRK